MKHARRMSVKAGASLAIGLLAASTAAAFGPAPVAEARARCTHGNNGEPGSLDHTHEGGNVRWYFVDHWNDPYGNHIHRMVTDRGTVDLAYC